MTPHSDYSPEAKTPVIQSGIIRFKAKMSGEMSRNLNLGRKAAELKLNPNSGISKTKPSKTLNKVKKFLNTASDLEFETVNVVAPQTGLSNSHLESDSKTKEDEQFCGDLESATGEQIESDNQQVSGSADYVKDIIDLNSDFKGPALMSVVHSKLRSNEQNSEMCPISQRQTDQNIEDSELREPVVYDLDMWNEMDTLEEDTGETAGVSNQKRSKKKKKKRKGMATMPPEIAGDQELRKYWGQRYRLFSKFDEGIRMDRGIVVPFSDIYRSIVHLTAFKFKFHLKYCS